MKKRIGAFLLTFLLAVTGTLPVYAAQDSVSLPAAPYAQPSPSTPQTTFGGSFYGTSYNTVYNGMTCYCTFNSLTSVTAGTSMSGHTVTITSKSYPSSDSLSTNGSGGNSGTGSTSTTYTASSTVAYVYNEHSAPYDVDAVGFILYRH